MKKEKVYDSILQIAETIAKEKKGALFVLGSKSGFRKTYEPLFPQILHDRSISEKGMKDIIEKLATLDGAVLLTHQGTLIANGVRLKRSKEVPGFGTKHAAAGASAALLGLAPTLVIGGTYLIVKTATGIIRKKFT